jgi:hypothetical protein
MTDRTLPPNPDGQNHDRAQSAQAVIRQFQICTGCDWDDAIADLLTDLMHLCDRETREDGETALDFSAELEGVEPTFVSPGAKLAGWYRLERSEPIQVRWSSRDTVAGWTPNRRAASAAVFFPALTSLTISCCC